MEEDDLFSPSSIGRYGQWEISEDWQSEDDEPRSKTAEEKYEVELSWRKMLERRKKQVGAASRFNVTSRTWAEYTAGYAPVGGVGSKVPVRQIPSGSTRLRPV
jgi:hypothetical protein